MGTGEGDRSATGLTDLTAGPGGQIENDDPENSVGQPNDDPGGPERGGGRLSDGPARSWRIALIAITALGAIPRLIAARESLAWDELYLYALIHDRGFGQMLDAVAGTEKTPPLGFILAWISDRAISTPQGIRIPSLIAGIAIVPLAGILGRQAFGRQVGVVAAAIAAASPFLLFYSVEARSYSLTTALLLAATIALLKASRDGGARWWVIWSAAGALALISHYTAVGVLAAQFGWALIALRGRRRVVLACLAGPALVTVVWLPWLLDQIRISSDELARINAVSPLGIESVSSIVGRNLIGHPLVELDRVPGQVGTWLVIAGVALALAFAALDVARRSSGIGAGGAARKRVRSSTWLLVAVALAAATVAIAVSSQPHQSMLFARNLVVSLPAAIVLVAALLARPPKQFSLIAVLLVVAGLATGSAIELLDAKRPEAREAALAVAARWQPGDRIVELCCLTGAEGPLGRAVSLNLPPDPRRSLSVLSVSGDRPYLDSLGGSGAVFVIGYVPEGSSGQLFMTPPAAWAREFRPVWQRRWPGILETVATEYRNPEATRK